MTKLLKGGFSRAQADELPEAFVFAKVASELESSLFAEGQPLRESFIEGRFEVQRAGSSRALRAILDQAISPSEDVTWADDVVQTWELSLLHGDDEPFSPVEEDLRRRLREHRRACASA